MKKFLMIFCMLLMNNTWAQGLRVPQRIFNYGLSYGPRGNSSYYSAGYEFSKEKTNAFIGIGYGKLMADLNLFNPNTITINGRPEEIYVVLNYVYTNKDYKWLILTGGAGLSVDGGNQIILKTAANLKLSYPLYLTLSFYQTDKPQFMIGGRLFIF